MHEEERPSAGAPASLAVAVEANVAEWQLHFARLPGGEVHEESGVTWYATGRPSSLLNGVVRTRLRGAARADELVAEFARRGVTMGWWTGPSTRPAHLGVRLKRAGLRRVYDAPGMVADLDDVATAARAASASPAGAAPAGLHVERVRDAAALELWLDAGQRLPSPGPVRALGREVNALLALDPDGPLRHYVGLLDGAPVAKATVFFGSGAAGAPAAAGVYNLLVHPDLRRRGIGAAMTAAPLREARALGYQLGVLASSAMAVGLYRRLGFRECARLGMYELRP